MASSFLHLSKFTILMKYNIKHLTYLIWAWEVRLCCPSV
jgi:hypothetical protein